MAKKSKGPPPEWGKIITPEGLDRAPEALGPFEL